MNNLIVTRKISKARFALYLILTLSLWSMLGYLLRNVPETLYLVIVEDAKYNADPIIKNMLANLKAIGIFALVAFVISILIGSWSLYNYHYFGQRKKRQAKKPVDDAEMAAYFDTTKVIIHAMRQSKNQEVDFTENDHLVVYSDKIL